MNVLDPGIARQVPSTAVQLKVPQQGRCGCPTCRRVAVPITVTRGYGGFGADQGRGAVPIRSRSVPVLRRRASCVRQASSPARQALPSGLIGAAGGPVNGPVRLFQSVRRYPQQSIWPRNSFNPSAQKPTSDSYE